MKDGYFVSPFATWLLLICTPLKPVFFFSGGLARQDDPIHCG